MSDLNVMTEERSMKANRFADILALLEEETTLLKGLSLLEREAARGDGRACALLGFCHEHGKGVSQSDENAVYFYQKAAEKGEKDALFALSSMLGEGRGIARNDTLSRDMLARAAHLDHPKAQNRYARLLLQRGHVLEARAYFEKALSGGERSAATSLGELYEQGIGVEQSLEKAIDFYQKAEEDDLKALFRLAVLKGDDELLSRCIQKEYPEALCYEGLRKQDPRLLEGALSRGIERVRLPLGRIYYERKEYEKAIPLLKSCPEGEAFYLLDNLYRMGVLPKSHKQAALCYQTSMELGYAQGIYALAVCYDTGFGMIRDEERAMSFYTQAAALGQLDSVYEIGRHKMQGLGTARDEEGAAKQYLLAADLGHIRSAYHYGQCLKAGIGTSKDEKKAYRYIELAAKGGLPEAEYDFGMHRLKTNAEEGASWLERAYERKDREAGIALADCYRLGIGKPQDEEKAFALYETLFSSLSATKCRDLSFWLQKASFVPEKRWLSYLTRAAEEGDALSQYEYAVCYDEGKVIAHDLQRCLFWLEQSSAQGNLQAKELLAERLSRGTAEAGIDEEKAFLLYRELFEKGIKRVGYPLGVCYREGLGTQKNPFLAANCFSSGAEAGITEAKIALAECYLSGNGVPVDRQKAYEQFRAAALAGDAQSAYRAYLLKPSSIDLFRAAVAAEIPDALCKEGLSVQDDPERGTSILARSANLGCVEGMYRYAVRLLEGKGVQKDEKQGIEWLKRANALGHISAGLLLAKCHKDGIGTERNLTEACRLSEEQGMRGNVEGMFWSAEHYRYGVGVNVNYARAYDWYLKAAEHGVGAAEYQLAVCYLDGIGTKQNLALAANWLKKAFFNLYGNTSFDQTIQKGVAERDGASLLSIGDAFLNGRGVAQDEKKAEFWVRKSANTGYAEAFYRRGRIFSFGTGVAPDAEEAFWNYAQGANLRSVDAIYESAVCYFDGTGVKQDLDRAKELFQQFNECNAKKQKKSFDLKYKITESFYRLFQSAVDGNAESQYVIASRFRTGFGISANKERAVYWLKKARENGNEDAERFLRELNAESAPEQEEAHAVVE